MAKVTTKARAITRKQKAIREIAERSGPDLLVAMNRLAAAIEVFNTPRMMGQGLSQWSAPQLNPTGVQYGIAGCTGSPLAGLIGGTNGKAHV